VSAKLDAPRNVMEKRRWLRGRLPPRTVVRPRFATPATRVAVARCKATPDPCRDAARSRASILPYSIIRCALGMCGVGRKVVLPCRSVLPSGPRHV